MSELTLSKGGITVTVYAVEVNDNYQNKISVITPGTGKANQSGGPVTNIVIDLLRVTQSIQIRGHITATDSKTSKEVRDELISLFKGANQAGGEISLSYNAYTSALTGFIERLTITETSSDSPTSEPVDYAKYTVQITFIVGEEA
jgi:hypothetical protein